MKLIDLWNVMESKEQNIELVADGQDYLAESKYGLPNDFDEREVKYIGTTGSTLFVEV